MAIATVDRTLALRRNTKIAHVLLAGGVVYLILYVIANDVVGATMYDGYSRMGQAISELSARGAESRAFMSAMVPVFAVLLVACGLGVWMSARGSRRLRTLGATLMAWGASHVAWLAYPMTSRAEMAATGSGGSSDVGHVILTALTFVFILSVIVLGALILGRRFLWYSIATAIVILVAGVIVAAQSAGLPDGKETPWMGLIERISAYGMMLYVAAVAVAVGRRSTRPETGAGMAPQPSRPA